MPQLGTESRLASPRCGLPCSAAWTPSWHHTDEITRTSVLAEAKGTLRVPVDVFHSPGSTERMVKYIANSPAKNISSLASQTMVPTDTMFGRDTGPWPGMLAERAGSEVTGDAVATCARLA